MKPLNITLVSGPPGVGKTTWIQHQLNTASQPSVYLSLGSGATPIDATYLAAEVSNLKVLFDPQWAEFVEHSTAKDVVYVELGFHLDLTSLILPVDLAQCQRVAILPPGVRSSEWDEWADVIVAGPKTNTSLQNPHLWRSPLTGQVLDPASLNTFWYELTNEAYGTIHRAKGIFDVADGRALYFDFVAGLSETTYRELNLPRWLNGRPDRFSGIEIIGEALELAAISQTINDCCLDEQVIAYYQQQVSDFIHEEKEEGKEID